MEQIQAKYPEAASYIEKLPEPVLMELGVTAVTLSHVDMHPRLEVQNTPGRRTELALDFSHVITDPEYDSSQLEDEAIHAAKLGQEKVADVVLATSKLLQSAHQQLENDGLKFGPTVAEVDDQRTKRERAERDTVYNAAKNGAVESALVAKKSGDSEAAIKALESVILLDSLQSGQDRRVFREAVRSGLTNELLAAVRTTDKLFTNEERVPHFLNGFIITSKVKLVLEMMTGKQLDDHFAVQGNLNPSDLRTPTQGEDIKDVVAVLTSKDGWLNMNNLNGAFESSVSIKNIMSNYNPEAAEGTKGSAEYFYQLFEAYGDSYYISDAFKCSDPKEAFEAADKLGIPVFAVISDFGRKIDNDFSSPKQLDSVAIDQMLALKKAHPQAYAELNFPGQEIKRSANGWDIGFSPADISEALDKLPADIEGLSGISTALTQHEDKGAFVDRCAAFVAAWREAKLSLDQVADVTKKSNVSLSEAIDRVGRVGNPVEIVSQLVLHAEIFDAYKDIYSKLEYPMHDFKNIEKPDLHSFPHLKERMMAVGLSEDLSAAMFNSWSTYNAFVGHYYSNDTFNLPQEAPTEEVLERMIHDQALALETQLRSLEVFVKDYGIDTTSEIIENFGIYNFARHDSVKLARQNKEWKSGIPVSNVVVEARYDWNSFTGNQTVFEEEVGDGVFNFEANSGTDAARIAVLVGAHEIANGRAPDVKRFILHAHAYPEGLVMGVNRELISTSMYVEAARNASKINANEINDYTRHLGHDFEVILEGCSTAGDVISGKNIAQTISERHDTKVEGSNVTIMGVRIHKDGSVSYEVREGERKPIIYDSRAS
ncbi:MAG TPA: hypothetical protein VMR76_02250 [Candidatus Saccharimonadia bacterium]|nr:hypothetical protein [Candidatus Saccharimonadia bacterium]